MKIAFTNVTNLPVIAPMPASKVIPDWYKKLESYIGGVKKPDGKGLTSGTIKRCMPVFDAITAGYIISTPCDIFVSKKDNITWYEWSSVNIEFHPIEQAPDHPARNSDSPYPKIINPWAIKTPKGYSCHFLPPAHRSLPIRILEGVVDTDSYAAPVNFPFVLTDPNFKGLIPEGTPIVQVVPFKRDNWTMEIESNYKEIVGVQRSLSMGFFDRYKKLFWTKKSYS
jgi:hypothetical protein